MSKRQVTGRRIHSAFTPTHTGRAAVAMAVETLERRSLMAATLAAAGKLLPAPKPLSVKPVVTVLQPSAKTAAPAKAVKVTAAPAKATTTKPSKAVNVTATPAVVGPAPVITEFVASNANGLTDGAGNHPDWIEIQNQGDTAVDLAGWHLSDNAGNRAKWTFPSVTVAPGAYLVVFADSATSSGPDAQGYLHTNFSLSADGENLSLSKPDNTVVSEFNPGGAAYPKQAVDVSYGPTSVITSSTPLVVAGAPAKAIAPTSGAIDGSLAWTLPGYVDTTWKSGTTGVGYDGGGTVSAANLVGKWDAQTLPANTTFVSTWSSSVGGYSAVTGTNSKRPQYVSNAIGGHAALRFDGVDDRLRVANQPLATAGDFSVAFVFRSAGGGIGGATQWFNNAGIVDGEIGGSGGDFGVAMAANGQVGGGVGDPDTTLYSSQVNLNDGNGHTVVFTKSGGTTALSIDGAVPVYGAANTANRSALNLAFGALQTDINYFNGDIGEVRLYNAAFTEDGARSLSSELAAHWSITTAAGAYTSQIGLDLKNEAAGLASTAAVRIPFTVSNPSQYNKLLLKMKYDDGFVAYLNGTEIARRNAPGGAITYTSTASAVRPDAAALTDESINVSSYLNLLNGSGQNILAIRALNASAGDSDLIVIPQLVGVVGSDVTGYMAQPTPGAANNFGYFGLVQTPTASVKHGFYSSPQSVTLTDATPGSTLIYTTDGSTPTLTNGTKVLPASSTALPTKTLTISSTTVLRMAAVRDGYLDSLVQAESYMFLPDILTQPEYTPAGAYWDVGMDTDVVNNTTQTWSVAQALTAIPTISMSLDPSYMFGNDASGLNSGIYTHPLAEGDAWERPASIEYFDPNNAANQFMINAGVRISGSYSRNISRPKKGFKLFFRAEYGQSKLEFPFFGTTNPQQVFDHLILRAGHNHSFANDENYNSGDYMRDQFARDTQRALTGKSANGNWAHLYINGQYWGLYNPTEDVDTDWAEANYGGTGDNYDIIKPTDSGGVEADDGTLTAYNALFALGDSAAADTTISTAEFNALAAQIDMKTLADYMLSSFYRGDKDGPVLIGSTTEPRNFIALRDRVTPGSKWYFQTQDGELSIDEVNFDRTELKGNLNPARLHNQLRNSPEYRQIFIDEYNKAFGANGALTVAANQARYLAIKAKIDKAIVGESARWGNAKAPYTAPVTRDGAWTNEVNWITSTYMPQRDTVIRNLIRADFPEIGTFAPLVRVNGTVSTGGVIASGATITLNDTNIPAGQVYYTLDGSDPRAAGGGIGGTATMYTGGFALTSGRTVNARVLKSGVWSPLTTAVFTLAPPSLRLSELMYNPTLPAGGTFNKEEYEFIEVANTGATTIDLSGMTLNTGAAVTVASGTTLAAGSRGVFVKNIAAFRQRYGPSAQILGEYTDLLANSSERVTLYDPNSATNVFDVTYLDTWYPTTDGQGYSLVVKDLAPSQAVATVLGVATAWRASVSVGGSPGLDDVVLPLVKLSAMTLDDGTVQRSRVRTATLLFDGTLTAANFSAGAITLTQTSGTVTPWTAVVSGVAMPVSGQTAVTVTFNGTAAEFGSLADGQYVLHVDGSKITDALGRGIDALGTGAGGSAKDYAVARLFGDADGDLGISINDFNGLAAAFGSVSGNASYNAVYDYDNDNGISINDFNAFAGRFGKTL